MQKITRDNILAQDSTQLDGEELLLFNLAYQLSQYNLKLDLESISAVVAAFEDVLIAQDQL